MKSVCIAPLTELTELDALLELLLVLFTSIAHPLTQGTLEFNRIILRHTGKYYGRIVTNPVKSVNSVEPPAGLEPATFTLQKYCSTS